MSPDAIVVLTSASATVLQNIRQRGPNIDSDGGPYLHLSISEQVIDLHELDRSEKGAPITLPMTIASVWLEIEMVFSVCSTTLSIFCETDWSTQPFNAKSWRHVFPIMESRPTEVDLGPPSLERTLKSRGLGGFLCG